MRVAAPLTILLAALGTALPASAQIVVGPANLTVVNLTFSGMGTYFVNAQDCDTNKVTSFRVTGLMNAGRDTLAVWRGNNCEQNRGMTSGNSSDCVFVTHTTLSTSGTMAQVDIDVSAEELDCSRAGKIPLYFLPMNSPMSETEEISSWGVDEAVQVDVDPPPPPTNVMGGRGETQIRISWDRSGQDTEKYNVYVDPNGGTPSDMDGGTTDAGVGVDNPECPSDVLVGGRELHPDDKPSDVIMKATDSNANSVEIDGSGYAAAIATVSVQAVDQAGNVSVLSATDCIEIVPTTGFYEYYKSQGGTAEPGCDCSTPGRGDASGGALVLAALCLLLWRRRSSP